ncbi:MAG TPA: hypothetical protein VFA21_10770 [Pyrinomonadaceae bacterium]|nr:hypothetical protein [Pyrinomonadaceae bacterium]
MSQIRPCGYCGHDFHISKPHCPHCARPALYGNVVTAEDREEVAALERRYEAAKLAARSRGAEALRAVESFEAEVSNTRAVIARPAGELQRLSTSDREGYASFYELIEAGIRFPSGNKWDALRPAADETLFPYYKDKIRFAALTLDGKGLPGYGECFIVLRTEMIEHRASAFEENSLLFFSKHFKTGIDEETRLPRGYRATWGERGKLCVAKLAGGIDGATTPDAYSGLLLRQGPRPEEDDFVEVHVWGPMTIRTVERVSFNKPTSRTAREITNRANKQRLAKFGVTFG